MECLLSSNFIFQQLYECKSSTYTYIIADPKTREGIIIDSVAKTVARDYNLLQELGIKLLYILDTHVHADHITGSGTLSKYTGAPIAMSANCGAKVDIPLNDGQKLQMGSFELTAISTPGHTNGCMCYYINKIVFTGDTLLIRGNGRTDFQEGSPEILYESITKKIFTLPDETIVYPAHDYAGFTSSTIEMEKMYNKRISTHTTKEQFIETMNHLNLPLPQKIDTAVPANLLCGR